MRIVLLLLLLMAILAAAALSGCETNESSGNEALSGEALETESAVEALPETTVCEEAAVEAAPEEPVVPTPPSNPPSPPSPKTPPANTAAEPAVVEIPGLLGMTYEEAAATLNSLGFQVAKAEDYSDRHAVGVICDQDPAGGGPAASGSTVTLVVSLGPASRTCPTCGGEGVITRTYTCPECGGTGTCYT